MMNSINETKPPLPGEMKFGEANPFAYHSRLINRFSHRPHWPWPKYVARGETSIPTHDLCHNWSIVWTKEMITEFLHILNPIGITYSPNVEWSLDVLETFPNLWWYEDLAMNSTCWNRVFPEYNQREYLFPLLDELLRREQRILKFDFF